MRKVVIRAGESAPRAEKVVAQPLHAPPQAAPSAASAPIHEPVVILDDAPPAPSRRPHSKGRFHGQLPERPLERPAAPRRQRDFLIRYDGRFIGHYHSAKPILPRLAFGQIAQELKHKLPVFDPALLELFRPIKLRVQGVARALAEAAGDFSWFDRSPAAREVRG